MSLLDSMNITGSALTAERFRMDVALQNLANVNTTRTAAGEPYRRKQVIFQERGVSFASALQNEQAKVEGGGVRVTQVVESQRVDLMAASNSYSANLTALSLVKSLALKALEIGK